MSHAFPLAKSAFSIELNLKKYQETKRIKKSGVAFNPYEQSESNDKTISSYDSEHSPQNRREWFHHDRWVTVLKAEYGGAL